jgi:hypothetical protein
VFTVSGNVQPEASQSTTNWNDGAGPLKVAVAPGSNGISCTVAGTSAICKRMGVAAGATVVDGTTVVVERSVDVGATVVGAAVVDAATVDPVEET